MINKIKTLLFVIVFTTAIPCMSGEQHAITYNQQWGRFLKNDFESVKNKNQNLPLAFYIAKVRGEYEIAFNLCLKMLEQNLSKVEGFTYLRRAGVLSQIIGKENELQKILKKIINNNNDFYPNLRLSINQELIYFDIRNLDKRDVELRIKNDGWIRNWAMVVGPFASKKPLRIDSQEEFEVNPKQNEYTDKLGRKVKIITDVNAEYSGKLNLSDIIFSNLGGAVYSTAFIKSGEDKSVVLSLVNYQNLRIWLNGKPIYKHINRGTYRKPRILLGVKIKKGINSIVVKSASYRSFGIRILDSRLMVDSTLKIINHQQGKSSLEPLTQIYGFVNSSAIEEPEITAYRQKNNSNIVSILNEIEAEEYFSNIQKARELRAKLNELFPDSIFIKENNSLFYNRESSLRIDSHERLQRDALLLANEIIMINKKMPRAYMIKGLYFQKHDENEDALKNFRLAVKYAPKWSSAWIQKSMIEEKLGLDFQAETSLLNAVKAGNYDAMEKLAGFLVAQNRISEAYTYYDKLWENKTLYFGKYLDIVFRQAEWKTAHRLIAEYEKMFPDNFYHILTMKIKLAIAEGKPQRALKLLDMKIKKPPFQEKLQIILQYSV